MRDCGMCSSTSSLVPFLRSLPFLRARQVAERAATVTGGISRQQAGTSSQKSAFGDFVAEMHSDADSTKSFWQAGLRSLRRWGNANSRM
jgi:hypothetical protein